MNKNNERNSPKGRSIELCSDLLSHRESFWSYFGLKEAPVAGMGMYRAVDLRFVQIRVKIHNLNDATSELDPK